MSVLWTVIILAMFAGGLLHLRSVTSRVERAARDQARMENILDAAINRAILALADTRIDKRWRVDGVPVDFAYDGMPVSVTVQDENGKIDINTADADVLKDLLQTVGIAPGQAADIADCVLDWRDATGLHRKTDYRAAQLAYVPRHGYFQSADELKLVPGITPDVFQRIEPAITVYSQRATADAAVAPLEVLLTFPGMNEAAATKVLKDRAGREAPDRAGMLDLLQSLEGRAFTIRAAAQLGQKQFVRERTIRITDAAGRSFLTLNWK
ncbi:MAG: general secretion pathway protein GspK [Bdellovibrionales bacterium]